MAEMRRPRAPTKVREACPIAIRSMPDNTDTLNRMPDYPTSGPCSIMNTRARKPTSTPMNPGHYHNAIHDHATDHDDARRNTSIGSSPTMNARTNTGDSSRLSRRFHLWNGASWSGFLFNKKMRNTDNENQTPII